MVPFIRPCRLTRLSSAWVSTSTSALPMPTTSSSPLATARLPSLGGRGGPGEVAVEQERQVPAGPRREELRVGDDRAGQRVAAAGGAPVSYTHLTLPTSD